MKRIAAHVVVSVPAELCVHAVQASLGDERLQAAYQALRPGREYSGWVTGIVPGRRVEIAFAALDPTTKRRMEAAGWRVVYEFTPAGDGRTRAEVAVEYPLLAALAAAGTLRAQAENEIMRRLAALVALELGVRHAADPAASGVTERVASVTPARGGDAGG